MIMARFLLVGLLLVPIIEIAGIWLVGRWLGFWPTLGLMLATSLIGLWMARREGRQAWQVFNLQLNNHEVPTSSAIDGVCILLAGLLLLAPGFLTDLIGFILLIPFSRAYIKGFLRHFFSKNGCEWPIHRYTKIKFPS
ncbi:FxsA protein [Geomicrobium sp. JCM 19055]|nr:FxsA protein [Geomicrobium sp. JCM 19055]